MFLDQENRRMATDRRLRRYVIATRASVLIVGAFWMWTMPCPVTSQPTDFFSAFTGPSRPELSPYKGYSGIRVKPDAIRMVYIHDQTVAVAEVGPDRTMYNCELIEIYNKKQGDDLVWNLTQEVSTPIQLHFKQMMELMEKCRELNPPINVENDVQYDLDRGFSSPTTPTILNGILPGTKWCGTGDLAETFFDLGKEKHLDKCCRNHDICPSKVRPNTTRYNLTNNAIFTKSHCECDLRFLQCLKKTKNPTANLMGNFYFNLLRVPCLNITAHRFQNAYRY